MLHLFLLYYWHCIACYLSYSHFVGRNVKNSLRTTYLLIGRLVNYRCPGGVASSVFISRKMVDGLRYKSGRRFSQNFSIIIRDIQPLHSLSNVTAANHLRRHVYQSRAGIHVHILRWNRNHEQNGNFQLVIHFYRANFGFKN